MPTSISDSPLTVMPAKAGIHDFPSFSMNLLIFGNGYSGRAIANAALQNGITTTVTSRTSNGEPGIIRFDAAEPAIAAATHIIVTAAPDEHGDPILARYAAQIAAAPELKYIGYLSTTGVYGNHNGAWVNEDTPPNPLSPRAQRRLAAEQAWCIIASTPPVIASASPVMPAKAGIHVFPPADNEQDGLPRRPTPPRNDDEARVTLDIFRLAGIYGPGRSMFDDLRDGTARRVVKPGHLFGRIHVADIAQGVLKAMLRDASPGVSIFNFSDDEPAASADVVVEAARLLQIPPPEPVPYEQAVQTMSPMALSFWAENRRVSNAKTKAALNLAWLYPTYREGLAAIQHLFVNLV